MILDASFLIDLERGNDAALAAFHSMIEDRVPMRVPAQAACEYIAGFEDPVANLHDLERSYDLLAHDREHILETARLAREGVSAGRLVGWADAQIAAAAVLLDEEVATANPEHFDALECDVWRYRDEARHPGSSDG